MVMDIADRVSSFCKNLGIPCVLKASYRKANRTSARFFTGLGDHPDLGLLMKNDHETFSLPLNLLSNPNNAEINVQNAEMR